MVSGLLQPQPLPEVLKVLWAQPWEQSRCRLAKGGYQPPVPVLGLRHGGRAVAEDGRACLQGGHFYVRFVGRKQRHCCAAGLVMQLQPGVVFTQ